MRTPVAEKIRQEPVPPPAPSADHVRLTLTEDQAISLRRLLGAISRGRVVDGAEGDKMYKASTDIYYVLNDVVPQSITGIIPVYKEVK